ncbi:MAG: hypothetical protein ACI9G1_004324 [Pirellulaceae bacterium]|jgi:hypothetical protein
MKAAKKIELGQIRVASPCSALWEKMAGDERSRFCEQCDKSVFNISGMPQHEAEDFLNAVTASVCVRLYRRADGTIITNDCPVGLRAVRLKIAQFVAATVALLGMLTCTVTFGTATFGAFNRAGDRTSGAVEALKNMSLVPAPAAPPVECLEMGEMAVPLMTPTPLGPAQSPDLPMPQL